MVFDTGNSISHFWLMMLWLNMLPVSDRVVVQITAQEHYKQCNYCTVVIKRYQAKSTNAKPA